ncbi:hypothetical protein E2C01_012753 [Portunus trituberculatus]|uniref:Uncharacterized protein n=1 Tax=Portunus trituberculatus TaxID=210409 RepID=A0A5B7DEZ2_PORTR|nr:hypothetical protein [Portunus trituberculatus]
MPSDLEVLFWKIIDSVARDVLCFGCYRPPSRGAALTDYLTENQDLRLTANQCEGDIIVGTSDHVAVITKVNFRQQREKSFCCTPLTLPSPPTSPGLDLRAAKPLKKNTGHGKPTRGIRRRATKDVTEQPP